MNKQKAVLLGSLGTAVIIAVLLLHYFLQNRPLLSELAAPQEVQQKMIPTQKPKYLIELELMTDTSGWATYNERKNNIEFKYPNNWIVGENKSDESAEKSQVAHLVKKSYPKDVSVTLYVYKTSNSQETLRNKLAMAPENVTKDVISYNGKKITILRTANEEEGAISMFVILEGKLFEITPTKPDGGYFLEYAAVALGVAQTLN